MSSSCFNFRTFEGQHSGAFGVCSECHDRNLQQNFRCQRQIWITQTKAIFLMKWHILYPRIILYTNVLLIRFPCGLWEVLIFNHRITCFLFWKFYKRTENTKLRYLKIRILPFEYPITIQMEVLLSHVLSDYLYAMLLSWNCRYCLSSHDIVSDMGKFCQMYTKTYITRYLFFYIYTYLIPLYDRSYFA